MENKGIKRCFGNKGSVWKYKKTKSPLEMYKFYLGKCKESKKKPVKYTEFKNIINFCNKEVVRQALLGNVIKLPNRAGYLQIIKKHRVFSSPTIRKHVNWGQTYKHNKILYYDDKFIYKWVWIKRTSILKNKTFFKFKPARDTARAIVGYVGDGQQYFGQIRK